MKVVADLYNTIKVFKSRCFNNGGFEIEIQVNAANKVVTFHLSQGTASGSNSVEDLIDALRSVQNEKI